MHLNSNAEERERSLVVLQSGLAVLEREVLVRLGVLKRVGAVLVGDGEDGAVLLVVREAELLRDVLACLLYTSPSPRDS